jgi:hypothetical protein
LIVLPSKLELKEELSLKDLFNPFSDIVKKNEYWGYYWAEQYLSRDLGELEKA